MEEFQYMERKTTAAVWQHLFNIAVVLSILHSWFLYWSSIAAYSSDLLFLTVSVYFPIFIEASERRDWRKSWGRMSVSNWQLCLKLLPFHSVQHVCNRVQSQFFLQCNPKSWVLGKLLQDLVLKSTCWNAFWRDGKMAVENILGFT